MLFDKYPPTFRSFVRKLHENIFKNNVIITYLLIVFLVVIFNLSSLRIDVIILDDLACYTEAIEGNFITARLYRSLVNPFINHIFVNVMAYSPFLARTMILILVMVPLSITFYHLSSKYLLLPRNVAFFSAVLPQILPGQAYIPAFIVGSYNTWGLLLYFFAVIYCLKYLSDSKNFYLIAVIILYFAAIEVTINIFLGIPIILLLLGFKKINRNHFVLFGIILIISIFKMVFVLLNPWATTIPSTHSINILLDRFTKMLRWTLPNPWTNDFALIVICFSVLIGFGFLFGFLRPINSSETLRMQGEFAFDSSDKLRWCWQYLFALSLFITSLIPFAVSQYFSSRYVYVAGFGLNLLIVLGIYSIFHRGILKKVHLSTIVLLILTIFVGIERNKSVEKTFGPIELAHSIIKPSLDSFDFPKNSQIVITGSKAGYLYTGGYWVWSTGYLKYTTGRKDITGIVGKEKTFYDPFNPKQRGYSYTMKGLDLNNPLFLFRIHKNQLIQMNYCLQWKGEDEKEEWTIYKIDPFKGNVVSFISGTCKSDFENILIAEGIEHKDVLWGG